MQMIEIQKAKNKSIISIAKGDLLIDNLENEDDHGPLELLFSDSSVLTLGLLPDGESAKCTWSNKQPDKLIDQNCEWKRIFLSKTQPFSEALNDTILEVDTLLFGDGKSSDVTAGFGFKLKKGNTIIYYNKGDFSKIYWNSLPEKLPIPFFLKWKESCFKEI